MRRQWARAQVRKNRVRVRKNCVRIMKNRDSPTRLLPSHRPGPDPGRAPTATATAAAEPPQPPHCMQTAPHCMHTAPHCMHTAPHCMHTAPHCIHTAPHCMHTAPHWWHTAPQRSVSPRYVLESQPASRPATRFSTEATRAAGWAEVTARAWIARSSRGRFRGCGPGAVRLSSVSLYCPRLRRAVCQPRLPTITVWYPPWAGSPRPDSAWRKSYGPTSTWVPMPYHFGVTKLLTRVPSNG